MDKKVNPLTAGSKVLCPHNCDVSRVVLFVLSILVLVAPILFIIHPLDAFEVKSFSGAFKPNILVDSYTKLLLLLKYIIGNYTYTGRLLSEIFYAGSVSLAFLIVKRYAGNYYSVVIVSLLAGVSNIWEPALLVSIKWFIVFLILAVIGFFIFLMSFINKDAQIFTFSKKNNIYLIAFAILILIGGGVSNSTYFKKSYPENLTFLLELAYNRGFMDRALVQVGENIDLNSVYYFADDVQKDEKGLYNLEGTVIPISGFDLDNYSKNLFIYTSDDAYEVQKLMDLLGSDSASYEINELNLGEYNLVLVERRSSPPMASDQPQ
jgi:hypothetical protein